MALEQNNTERPKGQHLTAIERGKIEAFYKQGLKNREIAKRIGVCHQTINNEIKRGEYKQVQKINGKKCYSDVQYQAETAQSRYESNRRNCHRHCKLNKVMAFIAHFISMTKEKDWSPDAVVGESKLTNRFRPEEMVCTTTLYSYIDAQLLEIKNIDLADKIHRNTKHHGVKKNKRMIGKSIETRPESVNSRDEFGHFEIDAVVGKRNGSESVLLTLTERQTRFEIIRLIDSKEADSVDYALKGILAEYGQTFKSITADNGSEFVTLENCVKDWDVDIYYTHPYTSSERGTNEVHNKMIRRTLPKYTSLDLISPNFVESISNKMNNLPRKIFGYRTPQEMFSEAVVH